ncbi:MAG: hypothetical protein SGCHY_002124 [Lobulomycetales sp.]
MLWSIQCPAARIVVLDISEKTYDLPNVTWYKCNVGDRNQVTQIAERIQKEIGSVSILVNNAGIVKAKSFTDLSLDDIDTVLHVNLLAAMYTCKAFLPGMLARKTTTFGKPDGKPQYSGDGHIVNIASVLGLSGCGLVSDYCASKAGLVGFHESLRQELKDTGVRTSLACPGMITTGMFTGVKMSLGQLTPPLETGSVSEAVYELIAAGADADLYMPTYACLVPMLRFVPMHVADAFRRVSGANEEMRAFRGSVSAAAVGKEE